MEEGLRGVGQRDLKSSEDREGWPWTGDDLKWLLKKEAFEFVCLGLKVAVTLKMDMGEGSKQSEEQWQP